jgi:tubulin polyglutamylase TTLL11
MHLTNYSLNKDHANFKTLDSETDIFGINDSSKRLFSSVLQQISADEHLRHIDIKALLANIEEVIVKFLAAMHPFILFNNMAAFGGTQNHKCFHVLGFDILLDEAGKPWILEVNANPSFNIEHEVYHSDGTTETELSPVDKYIKGKVVGDAV